MSFFYKKGAVAHTLLRHGQVYGLVFFMTAYLQVYAFALTRSNTVHNDVTATSPIPEETNIDITQTLNQISIRTFMLTYNIRTLEDYVSWLEHNMTYESDTTGDKWANPEETLLKRSGDCEDLSFLTAEVLRHLGYHPRVLGFGNTQGKAHVVCIFRKDGVYNIFDNTLFVRTDASSIKDIFTHLSKQKDARFLLELTLNPRRISVMFIQERKKT